ncbi:MAG: transcription antitermination factor NusB [Coriobacteriales bacterium]|jgi:N utilization substance protein B|nr:transcription antitermination factor NusB [Coriobacteriales bacterium]
MSGSQGQHQARTTARRKALQFLFQCEVCGCDFESVLAEGLCVDEVGIPCDFTKLLIIGVGTHAEKIDGLIGRTSENWSLERMPLVDRSILRLATFEMLYVDDVPYSVSINEAVELAKDFGGEDESSRFVNGVLGRIADHLGEAMVEGEETDGDRKAVGRKARSKREKKGSHG